MTSALLLRALASAGVLANSPGTAASLFDYFDRRGCATGPLIAVEARTSALARRLKARADAEHQVFLFPPRSPSPIRAPIPDTALRPEWETSTVDTHLADRDRDLECGMAAGSPLPKPRAVRLRRIDTILDGLAFCAAICLTDGRYSVEALTGGLALIRRCRPLVILDWTGLPRAAQAAQLSAIEELLVRLDYAVFDGDLFPMSDAHSRAFAIQSGRSAVFAAVPERLFASLFGADRPDDPGAWCDRQLTNALEAVAAGIGPRRSTPTIQVPCDGALVATGLYEPELSGGSVQRWSGPGRNFRVLLPVPEPGSYGIEMHVTGAVPGALDRVEVRAFGRPVPSRIEERLGAARISCEATIPFRDFRGWIDLEVRHGPTDTPSANVSRRAGVCLSGFTVTAI